MPVIVGSGCTEGTFGPDGGTRTVQVDTEEIFFVIPPGALSDNVFIKICGYKGIDSNGKVNFLYDCAPSGLEFAQPMVLHQPWPFGGSYVNSYFLSDDPDAVWTLEEVEPVTNNQTLINIHHFSKYGISN